MLKVVWEWKPFIWKWKKKGRRFVCKCDCWNIKEIHLWELSSGKRHCCWCSIVYHSIHWMTGTVEHRAWCGMRKRCYNAKGRDYKNYQGRWITVCDRWKSFENFYNDMWPRPDGTSIDRIDVNGNYEPSNCRWATHLQQVNNRKNTVWIEYSGMKKSIADWERYFWFRKCFLQQRLKKWVPFENAIIR
jgi:hypothetical protein